MARWLKISILTILIIVAVAALFIVLSLGKIKAAREDVRAKQLQWGAVIRPFAIEKADPFETTKKQFDLLEDLGANAVRANIESNDELNDFIVAEAKKRNIEVVLILEKHDVDYNDSGDFTAEGASFAKPYVERYKGKVNYYQLTNEITGTTFRQPGDSGPTLRNRDGSLFDATRYANVRDFIKGESDMVAKIDPKAKRIISGNSNLVDIFQMIKDDGVKYEIIGWDWYSDLGDNVANKEIDGKAFNYPEFAKSLGKEFWLVEVNRNDGSFEGKEKEQAEYIAKMADNAWSNNVGGFFVHMLTDFQPLHDQGIGHLGLVNLKENANGPWEIGGAKPAFNAYKAKIGKYNFPKGTSLTMWESLSLKLFPN